MKITSDQKEKEKDAFFVLCVLSLKGIELLPQTQIFSKT